MKVSAIGMRREGEIITLLFEVSGRWYRAAREYSSSSFSHIVELDHTGPGVTLGLPRSLANFKKDAPESRESSELAIRDKA